jgi:hypothetical protein
LVSQQDAPDFLPDALGRATADGFLPLQQVRLDFVVPQLDFPSLVVELDNLVDRVLLGVQLRREQHAGAEAWALVSGRCLGLRARISRLVGSSTSS